MDFGGRAWTEASVKKILDSRPVGRPSKYRPDFHPEDIVAYFRESFDAIEDPKRSSRRRAG